MHDADMPFTPEAWSEWESAGKALQALAFVSLDFQPRGNTVGNLRAITRSPLLRNVSYMAFRVAGALNYRISAKTLAQEARFAGIIDEAHHRKGR